MSAQHVNPATVATPTGYSHAVVKSGNPVFLAGQVSLDSSGQLVGPNDPLAQSRQIWTNIANLCQAVGASLADIVKITVFTTDLAYRPAIAEARGEVFRDGSFPASTFVVVSSLATADFLVEIEAVVMI